jgi:hypothetical protein
MGIYNKFYNNWFIVDQEVEERWCGYQAIKAINIDWQFK